MFNWTGELCSNGICQAYDEEFELPLFRDYDHINRIGSSKIFNNTKQTVEDALDLLKIS